MNQVSLPSDLAAVLAQSPSVKRFGELTSLLSDDAMAFWRARLRRRLGELDARAADLEAAVRSATASDARSGIGLGIDRLTQTATALRAHVTELTDVMSPFGAITPADQPSVYDGLRVGLAHGADLDGYASNIFRDWAWGDRENADNLALVSSLAPSLKGKRVLVLGCGAGRFAYDVHQQLAPELTVGLDYNPLLISLAARIANGEAIDLHEFPRAPIDSSSFAVKQTLEAPAASRAGLHYVLGNAFNPALGVGGFDAVITHWFVDIIPESFRSLCQRVNALLTTDGVWLNSGSFAFSENPGRHHVDPTAVATLDDADAVVQNQGFDVLEVREDDVDYLVSPYSRSARRERVVSWSTRKCSEVQSSEDNARHEADLRPTWLQSLDQPIEALPTFTYQAEATKIHAYVMALIDGKRSVSDIAAVFDKQNLMPAEEAKSAIAEMLAKMLD